MFRPLGHRPGRGTGGVRGLGGRLLSFGIVFARVGLAVRGGAPHRRGCRA